MKRVGWMLVAVALAGCASVPASAPPVASAPVATPPTGLFADARFMPPSAPVDADALFALSPAMQAFLREYIEPKVAAQGRHAALVEALYTRSALQLQYDSSTTRNAAEAFQARAGNCLSLVVMTSAFAKALGLNVAYQRVVMDDAIARSGDAGGDLYLAIGHINLTLAKSRADEIGYGFRTGKQRVEPDRMTIDFLPSEDLRSLKTRSIDEATVVGMYLNNRAVEALALGEVDDAYWWAREAVVRAPSSVSAINTLGVVYARHGDADLAERALRRVLAEEPANTVALSNLVVVLAKAGRADESRALATTLARLDPEPPFSWFIRGREAMRVGDYAAAKAAFAREVARAPEYHEFHFWLALAHLELREYDAAAAELELARSRSASIREQKQYAAKLAKLKQLAY